MAEQSTPVPLAVKVTCMIDHPTIKKKEVDLRLTANDWSKSLSALLTKIRRRFLFLSAMDSQWTLCINGETIDKSSVEAYKNSIAKTHAGQSKPHVQIIPTAAVDGGAKSYVATVHFNDQTIDVPMDEEEPDDMTEETVQRLRSEVCKAFCLQAEMTLCEKVSIGQNVDESPIDDVDDLIAAFEQCAGGNLQLYVKPNAPSRHIRVVFNGKSFAWVPPSTNNDADNEEADDDEKQWDAHYASFIQQAKQQFGITADVYDIQLQSVMGGNSCDLYDAEELHEIWSDMDESDDDTEVPVIKVIAPDYNVQKESTLHLVGPISFHYQLAPDCNMQGAAGSSAAAPKLGLSVGGAKDSNNFRDTILKSKRVPVPSSISYTGIFYDYYFDTGAAAEADDNSEQKQEAKTEESSDLELFSPSYCYAKSQKEHFISVGLNSNLTMDDWQRPLLNLVIVLDISGSMSSVFSSGNKLEVAKQCLLDLLPNLKKEDRLGLLLFDTRSYVKQWLELYGAIDETQLQSVIGRIKPRGGTNFEEGYKGGIAQFESLLQTQLQTQETSDKQGVSRENRLIFLTDAQPNTGATDPQSLLGMIKHYGERDDKAKIYTTVIGIGLDFNTQLVEQITKVRGANYFAVHSNDEFKKKMVQEFQYMVSPLVFNVKLDLHIEGDEYVIDKVYGANESEEQDDKTADDGKNVTVLDIKSLFPSPTNEDDETKGGIIVIKLKRNESASKGSSTGGTDAIEDAIEDTSAKCAFNVCASYEDKTGKTFRSEKEVKFVECDGDYFANDGIRKAILLARYVELCKRWMQSVRGGNKEKAKDKTTESTDAAAGAVSKEEWVQFMDYFMQEMASMKEDKTLEQEVEIMTCVIANFGEMTILTLLQLMADLLQNSDSLNFDY